MTTSQKRQQALREYSRRYRKKMTDEQREAKRAKWREWYRKNHNYQRSHAAPKANPKTHAPALISAARVRFEEGLDKPKREPCTCRNFSRCMDCRNQERRRATAAGEIPEYRLKMIAQLVATGD
jgi:hypothetical protein